jgi:hypothetical protein
MIISKFMRRLLLTPLEDVDILLDKQDEFFNRNNSTYTYEFITYNNYLQRK